MFTGEMHGMGQSDMFIREIRIDWDKVDEDSYVRDIPSIHGIRD